MAESYPTGMRLHEGRACFVEGHVIGTAGTCDHDIPRAKIEMRRIGWIDQKGNVWLSSTDWTNAGAPNGSITPLLIDPGCE